MSGKIIRLLALVYKVILFKSRMYNIYPKITNTINLKTNKIGKNK